MAKSKVDVGRRIADLITEGMAARSGRGSHLINTVAPHMGRLAKENPALAARIEAGDPDGVLEAYRWVVANEGFEGTAKATRRPKVELSMPPKSTDMIPYGVKGPGVPVGPARSTPQASPLPQRGALSVPQKTAPEVIATEFDKAIGAYRPTGLPEGLNPRASTGMIPYGVRGPAVPVRAADNPLKPQSTPGSLASKVGDAIRRYAPAAVAGIGGGLAIDRLVREPATEADAITSPSTNEDLVEETRPAPKVVTAPVDEGPPDYSMQAKQLIDQLNAMRRRAGGEVPEAKAMMQEIQRLLDLSNKQRNDASYKPRLESGDPGEQAIKLMQDLNARRRQAGGEVPDAQRVLQEITRLQRLSDERKWGSRSA